MKLDISSAAARLVTLYRWPYVSVVIAMLEWRRVLDTCHRGVPRASNRLAVAWRRSWLCRSAGLRAPVSVQKSGAPRGLEPRTVGLKGACRGRFSLTDMHFRSR